MVRPGERIIMGNAHQHHRQSIRLKGYDYARAGAYFVTIDTHMHACIFGDVADRQMRLNQFGIIVQSVWSDLPNHYPNAKLDAFVVMPDHVHGIIVLAGDGNGGDIVVLDIVVGAGLRPAPTIIKTTPGVEPTDTAMATVVKRHPLPEIIRAFKSFSARRINEMRGISGLAVWQRNYWEHIIRDVEEMNRIREYIVTNPQRWEKGRST